MTDLQHLGAQMRALVSNMSKPTDFAQPGRSNDGATVIAETIAILGALTAHLGYLGISPYGRAYEALASQVTMDLAEFAIRRRITTLPVIDAAVLYITPGPASGGPTREGIVSAAQRLSDLRTEVEKSIRARQ